MKTITQCGTVKTVGHYSNLSHVLWACGKAYEAKYRGDEIVNGKRMAKYDVSGITIYTAMVGLASAVAWWEETDEN